MKRLLTFCFFASCYWGALLAQPKEDIAAALIPRHVSLKVKKGVFKLNAATKIAYADKAALPVGEMLAMHLNKATGWNLKPQKATNGSIVLQINKNADDKIGTEGYYLKVDNTGVQISANTSAGLFYGMQSLLQLMPEAIESPVPTTANWQIPAVEIIDYPRFGWRGIMLDVSRHFFTKEEVKRYIDQIARLKFNTLHWHLTDDHGWRIEIKALPKLTQVGLSLIHI